MFTLRLLGSWVAELSCLVNHGHFGSDRGTFCTQIFKLPKAHLKSSWIRSFTYHGGIEHTCRWTCLGGTRSPFGWTRTWNSTIVLSTSSWRSSKVPVGIDPCVADGMLYDSGSPGAGLADPNEVSPWMFVWIELSAHAFLCLWGETGSVGRLNAHYASFLCFFGTASVLLPSLAASLRDAVANLHFGSRWHGSGPLRPPCLDAQWRSGGWWQGQRAQQVAQSWVFLSTHGTPVDVAWSTSRFGSDHLAGSSVLTSIHRLSAVLGICCLWRAPSLRAFKSNCHVCTFAAVWDVTADERHVAVVSMPGAWCVCALVQRCLPQDLVDQRLKHRDDHSALPLPLCSSLCGICLDNEVILQSDCSFVPVLVAMGAVYTMCTRHDVLWSWGSCPDTAQAWAQNPPQSCWHSDSPSGDWCLGPGASGVGSRCRRVAAWGRSTWHEPYDISQCQFASEFAKLVTFLDGNPRETASLAAHASATMAVERWLGKCFNHNEIHLLALIHGLEIYAGFRNGAAHVSLELQLHKQQSENRCITRPKRGAPHCRD